MASPRNRSAAAKTVAADIAFSLAAVIDATKAGGFLYTPAEFHQPLVESGDVEVNAEMVEDGTGNLATRATAKHLESKDAMTEAKTPEAAAKPSFVIETVPMPEKKASVSGLRAGRTPIYPFDALEIGQSFFVADKSADKPAFKAMASTVAGANARFTEEIAGQTRVNRKGATVTATKQLRKFKIFDTERTLEDGTVQKGARVFRVELAE